MLGRPRNILRRGVVLATFAVVLSLGLAVLTPAGPSSSPASAEAREAKRPTRAWVTVAPVAFFDVDAAIAAHEQAERDRIEAERVAAELAAAEAARYAGIYPSVEFWARIHACEQPDSWVVHGRFGNGLMGGGGLGLSDGAWIAWGGLAYAPYAGLADPLDQMRVASVGYRLYGGSPWGCR